jgi:hypothetical protein
MLAPPLTVPPWRNNTLKIFDFLVILALAVFLYGLVPAGGAIWLRGRWRNFRRRFDSLRLKPVLDYGRYRDLDEGGREFRFTGGFESITDGHTLWIRSDSLTLPVALHGAETYVLSMQERQQFEVFDPSEEAPERIRWDRVSTLAEGAKVFVGGAMVFRDKRWTFVSTKECPLMVIFYDGPDHSLTSRVIRAGRRFNEYWNPVTPYALIAGALALLYVAVSFLSRPVFRLTALTAFIAVFLPLFPMIPPGLIFTVVYRKFWWRARAYRVYRDLVRLPLRYLAPGEDSCLLPGGERYGMKHYQVLTPDMADIPRIIPGEGRALKEGWYVFGKLNEGETLPWEPEDSLATYGAVPGKPDKLAHSFILRAYTLEILAWLLLLFGIALNTFFIGIVIFLL